MALKDFAIAKPKPLPVILLADVSGSMGEDGKIEALNAAVRDMIETFSKESRLRAEIQVSIITFGGQAKVHLPLTPVHELSSLDEFQADGGTPMGAAFVLAQQLIQDQNSIPSRACRPTIVLVSDGHPTDDWETAFRALSGSERSQRATRFAMAIGADADEAMLKSFVNDREAPVFRANNARDIHRFFRAVTMSVSSRSQRQNPDETEPFVVPPPPEDDFDLDFERE